MDALVAGFLLGVGVAAGLGPISLLCISSGLKNGFRPAFGVGLGAAIVDGLYALAAGLGAAALIAGRTADGLRVVGGLTLVVVAWHTWHAEAGGRAALDRFGRALRVSLLATLANPSTIVYWAGTFAATVPALKLSKQVTATILPLGVFLGSLTWFLGLSTAAGTAGHHVSRHGVRAIARIGALAIGGFGLWTVWQGIDGLVR
jgi:putative LysE/RhtB family amino acid efflux pump